MATDLQDLVAFLSDAKVKHDAIRIVEGLTGSADGIAQLKTQAPALTKALLRLLGDNDAAASRAALVSLVNLSQEPEVVDCLMTLNVVGRIMDYLREKTNPHGRLLLMLLANVTISTDGAKALLQLEEGQLEGLHMAVLLKMLMVSGVTLTPGEEDTCEHVAAIITNVTRLKEGRQLLLQPGRGLLQALASQLASTSALRKQGCSSALRNCCLAAEEDGSLDSIVADSSVLLRMLEPINGLPPIEKDDAVRAALAESIQALASTEVGRSALRAVDAPAILHKGYEYEEHPAVCQAMEHASRSFLFDADGELETC